MATRRHQFGDFELRPPTVAKPIEVFYWARYCPRCGYTERRWFKITLPAHARKRITKPTSVRRFLTLTGVRVPPPDEVKVGMPRELRKTVQAR